MPELGALGEGWWSLLGEEVEVRNSLFLERQD